MADIAKARAELALSANDRRRNELLCILAGNLAASFVEKNLAGRPQGENIDYFLLLFAARQCPCRCLSEKPKDRDFERRRFSGAVC